VKRLDIEIAEMRDLDMHHVFGSKVVELVQEIPLIDVIDGLLCELLSRLHAISNRPFGFFVFRKGR